MIVMPVIFTLSIAQEKSSGFLRKTEKCITPYIYKLLQPLNAPALLQSLAAELRLR